ncbi:hypothetical protein BDY24DRAFT_340990 [Mrakia frigida]|uniref:BRCT domain-containing protein n=1 Tax=Mrakia frigida TaxID=29902 RepID=UPI003FCBFFB4
MPNLAELAQAGPFASTTTNKVRSTAGGRPSFPSSSSSRVLAPPPNPPSSSQSGIPTSTSSRRLSSILPSSSNRRDSSSSSEGDSSFTGGVSLTSSKSTGSVGSLAHQIDKDGAKALSGVVAFVDVRTAEGDEAGGMFVEILRGLGAKVLVRPSDSVTHIIFKAGKSSTLAHYRNGPSSSGKGPIHMVGIGWVIRCKEEKKRVSEFEYKVDVAEQSSFQKVR